MTSPTAREGKPKGKLERSRGSTKVSEKRNDPSQTSLSPSLSVPPPGLWLFRERRMLRRMCLTCLMFRIPLSIQQETGVSGDARNPIRGVPVPNTPTSCSPASRTPFDRPLRLPAESVPKTMSSFPTLSLPAYYKSGVEKQPSAELRFQIAAQKCSSWLN